MPYIITITQPCGAQFGRCKDPSHAIVSRRAVATLDEARKWLHYHGPAFYDAEAWQAVLAFGEEGGTVDTGVVAGTVVKVKRLTWPEMYAACPAPRPGEPGSLSVTESQVIDAFNARQS